MACIEVDHICWHVPQAGCPLCSKLIPFALLLYILAETAKEEVETQKITSTGVSAKEKAQFTEDKDMT